MKKKEVVQILQYYQHDVMNDIQVIHGYLSMDKTDVAKDKINDFINEFNEGRKLLKINAPRTILWIIQFNDHHENMRLTYQVNDERLNLQKTDDLVVENCQQFFQKFYEVSNKSELYAIHLQIEQRNTKQIVFRFTITGELEDEIVITDIYKLVKQNPQINMNQTKQECIVEFTFLLK